MCIKKLIFVFYESFVRKLFPSNLRKVWLKIFRYVKIEENSEQFFMLISSRSFLSKEHILGNARVQKILFIFL